MSLNLKHMEFIWHWKKIEGGGGETHSNFERNQELMLSGSGTFERCWVTRNPHWILFTGTNVLLSRQKSTSSHSQDQAITMMQVILRPPLMFCCWDTSPGTFLFQQCASPPVQPSSLTLLSFQNVDVKIENSSLQVFLSRRYSVIVA